MKKTIFISLSLLLLTAGLRAQDTFRYDFNSWEIYLLSEGQGPGDPSILIDPPAGAMEKYLVNGSFPTAVNAFLLRSPEQTVLFDTGHGRKLFENLASVGCSPEQIDYVFLTHLHGDHIGGLLTDGAAAFPNAKLVISRAERDYWTSDMQMNLLPEEKRGNFLLARNAIHKYGERVIYFEGMPHDGIITGDGIYGLATYGHTPGHVAYMLVNQGERFIFWGDLTHAMAIQMPRPEISVTYDVDPDTAAYSRRLILEMVAGRNIPVAGMHIPYPGIGTIDNWERDGYLFIPSE